jgi:hypothetical protein
MERKARGEKMTMSREDLDDWAASARDIARIVKAQHDAFLEMGYSPAEASVLIGQRMAATLRPPVDQ